MKRIIIFLVLISVMLSAVPMSYASNLAFENRSDAVFKGWYNSQGQLVNSGSNLTAQYVEIGADMNGLVGVSSSDENPVPATAKYTNGFYIQGAQLRYEKSGFWFWETATITGMRFVIVNNVDMISKMQEAGLNNISYGALVEVDGGHKLTENVAKVVKADNIFKTSSELGTDYQKFTVCITNIDSLNVRTNIAVRPYLTYTDLSGESHTLYGEQYACNIYAVGADAYFGGQESDSVNKAIENSVLTHYPKGQGGYMYSNEYKLSDTKLLTNLRKKTDKQIAYINSTPNMQIPAGATVYYVSNKGNDKHDGKTPATAWATLEKVSNAALNPGDYVLFERGGYFRGIMTAKTGVTYSAYGEGEKPIICGSPENGADPSKWTEVAENIWRYETVFDKDVGTMVFNHGEAHAVKWLVYKNKDGALEEFKRKILWNGVTTITEDLHFWHNNAGYSGSDYKVYLYSEQNPGERFESIEFLHRVNGVGVSGDNVTIDNLCVKYVGAHGIGAGTRKDLTVQNCEFMWIGGSLHFVSYGHQGTQMDRPVRFGNAVQIYGGCDGFEVSNCYFYQIYDAAVTHQYQYDEGATDTNDIGHYNVLFKDNVMEYCVYSIEFFLGRIPTGNPSHYDNVVYDGNLMWYAGEGLGAQRPDTEQPAHIKGWGHQNPVKNFVIKNNVLVYSTAMLIHTNFTNINENGEIGVKLENNILIGRDGQNFGMLGFGKTDSDTTTYTSGIQGYLKNFTNGDEFYFID